MSQGQISESTTVIIRNGALAGVVGEIVEFRQHDRVLLRVDLGSDVYVEMDAAQIQPSPKSGF